MADAVLFQIDEITKTLVGTNTSPPGLYHPYTENFHIQIVRAGDLGAELTVQDKSASSLRMILCSLPNALPAGNDGVPVIYAETDDSGWTWDATNEWFEGGLDLDTAPLRSAIYDNSSVKLYLFILLTTDGIEKVIYGPSGNATNVTINATPASSTATASAPTPAASYYTKTESDQRYHRLLHGSGSPEGVVTATVPQLYIDDDIQKLWYKQTGSGNTGWFALVG